MNEASGAQKGGQGDSIGAQTRTTAEQLKEHLREATHAATDAVRGTSQQARGWTRDHFNTLQDRVEAEPYRAMAWALGIGFVAGIVLTAVARSGGRRY